MRNSMRVFHGLLLVLLLTGCGSSTSSPAPSEVAQTPVPVETSDCPSLITAIKNQDVAQTRSCLKEGEDPNLADSEGLSPLNYAASFGNIEIVEALLEAGSDVNYQDPWGMTSLHAALKEGHDEVAVLLMEYGADVNLQTTAGYYIGFSPLHTAIFFNKVDIATIEKLLEQGADLTAVDQTGQTPQQMASQKGLTEIEALVDQKWSTTIDDQAVDQ